MFGLCKPSILRQAGILGLNKRNFDFILQYNPRARYPLVDNKLKTKQLIESAGLAAPKLLGIIETPRQLRELSAFFANIPRFVIKPARGSGGKGILVIANHDHGQFSKADGSIISLDQVERHVANIIGGLFSLSGKPDVAIIEEMIEFDDTFLGFSFEGVPDIRVILFKGFPVMAMVRLSTHHSHGKANLHQGAIGVGIDMTTGKAMHAIQSNQPISHHPDTGIELASLHIPSWPALLTLASQCYDITQLGYLGVDLVLDKHRGPMILEMNARPGLSIQLTNGVGLLPRLHYIEQAAPCLAQPADRIAFVLRALRNKNFA